MADSASGASLPPLMPVQVCYALPASAFLVDLQVAPGTTLEQAVRASGLLQAVPELDLASSAVGIYAKKKTLDTVLRAHDRVEVYRPLIADPKEARRRRAGSRVAKGGAAPAASS